MQVRVELRPVDEPELPSALEPPAATAPDVPLHVEHFLEGKECIEGVRVVFVFNLYMNCSAS